MSNLDALYRGLDSLSTGYVIAMFLMVFFVIVAIAEAAYYVSLFSASALNTQVIISSFMFTAAVSIAVNIPINYYFFYRSFSYLATVNPIKYGIGKLGVLISILNQVVFSIAFSVMAAVSPYLSAFKMLSIIFGITSFGSFILIAIALYRLAEEYSNLFIPISIVLFVLMYLFNMLLNAALASGIFEIVGVLLMIVGLNEIKKKVGKMAG